MEGGGENTWWHYGTLITVPNPSLYHHPGPTLHSDRKCVLVISVDLDWRIATRV